jgi:hypothetical protein
MPKFAKEEDRIFAEKLLESGEIPGDLNQSQLEQRLSEHELFFRTEISPEYR